MLVHENPLTVVNQFFESQSQNPEWERLVAELICKEVSVPDASLGIMSVNIEPNHLLKDGQLVKFRCMVQDMFDPEFYLSKYQVKSLIDGSVKTKCGRYRDTVSCGPSEELVSEGPECQTSDRLSFYCVSPPGESAWVLDHCKRNGYRTEMNKEEASFNKKRSLDVEMDMDDGNLKDNSLSNKEDHLKKQKVEKASRRDDSVHEKKPLLNLPVNTSNGKACVVKFYDIDDGDLKLNDLIEVIGILSLDPTMSVIIENDEEMGNSPIVPPPSLVPRIHVVKYNHLSHNNPLLPASPPFPPLHEVARIELLTILTSCLLGDKLAAEYLLLHLISKIYLRRDVLVLGKLSLNIHNMTPHQELPRRLATLLSLFVTKSHFLPLSRDVLDTSSFVPKKDFDANRLVTGTLQLGKSTHLWLDETVMTDGQLNANGLKNLTALGNLITWQKLEYDFQFQSMEYETDIPCLIMSEGRSMLPCDMQIMLKPCHVEARPDLISKTFNEIGSSLSVELLDRIRQYITTCKMTEYNLTDQVMNAVQDDFVSMRQTDEGMTVEDFHSLLVLGRLSE